MQRQKVEDPSDGQRHIEKLWQFEKNLSATICRAAIYYQGHVN